jgi:hypothetical protein
LDNDAMKKMPAIFAAIGFLLSQTAAPGALTVTLAPSMANAAHGTELVFSGAFTNTSNSNTLFLNDIQVVLSSSASNYVRLNANGFFANVPGLLLPGEAYTGAVFQVLLLDTAPAGDYEGSITLQGGADILAADDLASAAFFISSPTVSIVATDPTASEFGADSGSFTVSRTGGTDVDLTVACAISGSATNGVTYSPIPSSITIPARTNAAATAIVPIPDDFAQGDRTATLTIIAAASYNPGSNVAATITIHDKPFDNWRVQKFGAAANDSAAADLADWDGDGIHNLLEYTLNMEPAVADIRALPVPRIVEDHLTWSYVPSADAIDAVLVVEASTDLIEWSSADVEIITIPNPDPPERITVRCRHPASLTDRAFLRLRASRIQP